MKTPTPKRAAAAIVIDWIDRMRCGAFDEVKDDAEMREIVAQFEKIIRPVEDRMLQIASNDYLDIKYHYETYPENR